MTVWTTPVHQSPNPPGSSSTFNAQVVDNLQFLHDGRGLYVTGMSEDCNKVYSCRTFEAVMVPTMTKDVITVSRLAFRANATGGQMDVGIFLDDGNGETVSKVTSSGIVPMTGGAGARSAAFSASATLEPLTLYWLVMSFNSTNGSLNGTDGPAQGLCKKASAAYPLPNVITFGSPKPLVSPCLAALP